MQSYPIVVCDNCGCSYNPYKVGKLRPKCPATNCKQENPYVEKPKKKPAAKKAATKKDDG